jgi:hypothetical protein
MLFVYFSWEILFKISFNFAKYLIIF